MQAVLILFWLAVVILVIASMWKVFVKAGKPGWGCIIPIYNAYLLILIAGKPGSWLLLMLVPIVNIVITIIVYMSLAEQFGKSGGFGIGLWLLPIVFFPILAFSDARYGAIPLPPRAPDAVPPPAPR